MSVTPEKFFKKSKCKILDFCGFSCRKRRILYRVPKYKVNELTIYAWKSGGGSKSIVWPRTRKSGGQLTPLTPCFHGLAWTVGCCVAWIKLAEFMQPVEQLVECLYTRYNRMSNRLFNRFDNRLYRVNGVSLSPTVASIVLLPHEPDKRQYILDRYATWKWYQSIIIFRLLGRRPSYILRES